MRPLWDQNRTLTNVKKLHMIDIQLFTKNHILAFHHINARA